MSHWSNSCTPSLRLRACPAQLVFSDRENQGDGEAEVEITGLPGRYATKEKCKRPAEGSDQPGANKNAYSANAQPIRWK